MNKTFTHRLLTVIGLAVISSIAKECHQSGMGHAKQKGKSNEHTILAGFVAQFVQEYAYETDDLVDDCGWRNRMRKP